MLRWHIQLEETVGTRKQCLFKDENTTHFAGLFAYKYLHFCHQYAFNLFLQTLEVIDAMHVNGRASQQGNINLSVHFY